ncbi:MAG: IS1380-like element ISLsp5 family transposase, partial [Leptospirillia bacterium]
MARNACTEIILAQTLEPLTGQGGFLAFGEYLKGMKLRERVSQHLPA